MCRSNIMFICLLSIMIGNTIFSAADPYYEQIQGEAIAALRRVMEQESTNKDMGRDIACALAWLQPDGIVSVLPQDPEERKKGALYLLERYRKDAFKASTKIRHSTGTGKKLLEVCEKTQFDEWEAVPVDCLAFHPDISNFLIDRWVHAHNRDRLDALMQQLVDDYWFDSYHRHEVMEKYFLSVPSTELRSLDAQHQKFFISYIFGALINPFWTNNPANSAYIGCNPDMDLSMENAGIAKLSTVCRRISPEDFDTVLKILERSSGFQHCLWKLERTFPGCFLSIPGDPYMQKFQEASTQLIARTEGWIRTIGVTCPTLIRLPDIYKLLLEKMRNRREAEVSQAVFSGDNEKIVNEEKAVLLHMFASLHNLEDFNHEDHHHIESILKELTARGMKPNTKLHPADASDQRTLYTAYIICMLTQKETFGMFNHLSDICALLSEEELEQETTILESSDEFHARFVAWGSRLKDFACPYIKKIVQAGERRMQGTTSDFSSSIDAASSSSS